MTTKDKTRRTWYQIKSRCTNPNRFDYKHYGGRGIKMCKRWEKYENFLKDMGEKLQGKTIDRIDPNKDYSPKNCRWATMQEQNRNKRSNVKFKGECAVDASLRLGNYKNLVQKRIKRGWDIEKAFTYPSKHKELLA